MALDGLQKPGDEHFGFGKPETTNHPTPGGSSIDQRYILDLANMIAAVLPLATARKLLPNPPTRGGIPEVRAQGLQEGVTRKGTGGAIASPLTEGEIPASPQLVVLDREYYDPEVASSSDGILSFEFQQLNSITMIDANGAVTTFIFAQET